MNSHSQKDAQVRRVIVIEGLANAVVLVVKSIVGFSTGSLAILGDAIHSLTDVMNNIVAWIVMRVSSAPADRNHPYGHRKFETLAVFGLASLLVVLAVQLALQALRREDVEILSGGWEIGMMLGVLCTNIGLATWQRRWAKRLDSPILLADASHTFADVLTTIVVIAGWQLSAMGYVWLDRLCALGVAGLVLYLAFNLFRSAVPVLVDESAIDPEILTNATEEVDGVNEVVRVRSRWMGSDRAVDMIVTVDPLLPTLEAHRIADRIEAMLEADFSIEDVSIHIEPDRN
ncbi:MAG: cation diffusion facilitator family transporter [Gammaproteobacteria bacterium]|nr:cation diffusion facilitator family transporter [Gammaproteobacteria bacterium]